CAIEIEPISNTPSTTVSMEISLQIVSAYADQIQSGKPKPKKRLCEEDGKKEPPSLKKLIDELSTENLDSAENIIITQSSSVSATENDPDPVDFLTYYNFGRDLKKRLKYHKKTHEQQVAQVLVNDEIEAFLLNEKTLDTLCGASVVYITIEDNALLPYDSIREIVDQAVNSSLLKIKDLRRRAKVESGYISVKGLKALMVLNMDREFTSDHGREEIEENLNTLRSKLEHPTTEADINLYGSLKQALASMDSSDLTWRDPEASMVLSDDSEVVKNLGHRQKKIFIEPRENMKCVLPDSVVAKCDRFAENFNNSNISMIMMNIFHDKKWKENENGLVKITERILGTLGEIWNNPTFMTITSRSEQSEGTYVADVIIPLLRASLNDLPNGSICLSTAERQSIASKARRNLGISGERMGKKPDVMGLLKQDEKIIELLYTESSRIVCNNSKKADDDVKLWRETLDGVSYISAMCRPAGNQFGIVGIQIAGTTMYLNVLVKDLAGIPRYFHLDHSEIPLTPHRLHTRSLVRLLLTLRNIMIVNKSLLVHALEQAITHPPRNVKLSPTVSSPRRDEQRQKRSKVNSKTRKLKKRKSAYF
ncbi:11517_t:CDS:2, partial [Scutellospora calospora]